MQNLPALIDTARTTLAEAKTSAEVLEAKAQAQAALHYSKVTKAALQVQGDCLKMVCRAEERFAEEIDAGQERGEVASGGTHGEGIVTYDGLGVRADQIHNFRKVRDLGSMVKLSPQAITWESVTTRFINSARCVIWVGKRCYRDRKFRCPATLKRTHQDAVDIAPATKEADCDKVARQGAANGRQETTDRKRRRVDPRRATGSPGRAPGQG